jgi:hypothetical protein
LPLHSKFNVIKDGLWTKRINYCQITDSNNVQNGSSQLLLPNFNAVIEYFKFKIWFSCSTSRIHEQARLHTVWKMLSNDLLEIEGVRNESSSVLKIDSPMKGAREKMKL